MFKRTILILALSVLSSAPISSAQVPEPVKPTAPAPTEPPQTLPDDFRAGVTSDVRQALLREGGSAVRFDLECRARGRVVWERDPTAAVISPNVQHWQGSFRLVVDLDAMRYCYRESCGSFGPLRVEALDGYRIIFSDDEFFHESVGAADGGYEQDHFDNGRLDVTEGRCRRAPFSGFPAIEPHS